MPWRRPKKQVERPIDVRRSLEESLEDAAEGEEEEDLVELVDLDGASIAEAAAGEPDAERLPTEIADKLRESLAGAVITEVRAVPHAPPETLPEHGIDLSVEAARGLWLKNPVLTASGTFGQGVEHAELIDVTRLRALVDKGTQPDARPGNRPDRVRETPAGIPNSIGVENRRRARSRGGRGRWHHDHQHRARHADQRRQEATDPRHRQRRPVRSRDPSDRAAYHLSGRAGGRDPGHRRRRRDQRERCARVPHG